MQRTHAWDFTGVARAGKSSRRDGFRHDRAFDMAGSGRVLAKATMQDHGTRRSIIALVVDHPKRDLAGLVLVAHHLAAMGRRVALVPMYQQGIDVSLLNASPILVNYARENNHALLRGYVRQGRSVAVLDTEGGVLSGSGARSPEGWARYVRDGGHASFVSRYFFWGRVARDAFVADGVVPPDKAIVTGSVRHDLCSCPWRTTLGGEATDYVLINANFPLVNSLLSAGDAIKTVFRSVGHSDAFIEELYSDTQAVFRAFLHEVRRIIATHENQRFVLRPHPFERRDIYEEHLHDMPNVRVDPCGDVLTAILRAKAVIHINCGTAVEANLLRRVPLQLQYLSSPLQDDYSPLPSKVSVCLSSPDDLDRVMSNLEAVITSHSFGEAALIPYFGPLDGHAARRVAEHLADLPAPELGSAGGRLRWAAQSGIAKPTCGQLLQGAIGSVLGTRLLARLRAILQPSRGSKRFDVLQVNRLLSSFTRHPGAVGARAQRATHPLTGAPLESVIVEPVGASSGRT
jgi:surface carbohydrate biosynthesis protein